MACALYKYCICFWVQTTCVCISAQNTRVPWGKSRNTNLPIILALVLIQMYLEPAYRPMQPLSNWEDCFGWFMERLEREKATCDHVRKMPSGGITQNYWTVFQYSIDRTQHCRQQHPSCIFYGTSYCKALWQPNWWLDNYFTWDHFVIFSAFIHQKLVVRSTLCAQHCTSLWRSYFLYL